MAQEDIIKLLEKTGEALSLSEIAEELKDKMNLSAVTRAISRMTKYGEIESIEIDLRIARRIFGKKVKNKLKMYFID